MSNQFLTNYTETTFLEKIKDDLRHCKIDAADIQNKNFLEKTTAGCEYWLCCNWCR